MSKLYPLVIKVLPLCLIVSFSFTNTFAKEKYKPVKLSSYIPSGFELLDSASGDLNADGYKDYAIVLRSSKEDKDPGGSRPLLLLLGTPKGGLELLARNDQAILCSEYGGLFGDPYQKISVRDNYLSVAHTVGSSWKWTRTITFKFIGETNSVVLHDDESFSYRGSSPVKQPGSVINKTDFDNLPFTCFTYNKGY